MKIEKLIEKVNTRPSYFHFIKDKYKNDHWLYNVLLNTYEYRTKPISVTSIPIDVFLPLVAYCNANCLFCKYCNDYNYCFPPEKLELFKNLLRYVKNFGFNCYGEPLLHPDFDSIGCEIRKMLDSRATTYLVTNGILLAEKIDSVKRYCDSVNISLNAATPKTHSRLMGVKKDCFYNILEAIKELVHYKKQYKQNLLVQVSFCVTSLNFKEIPKFIKLCNELQVDKIYLNPLNLATKSELEKSKKTNLHIYKKLSLENVDNLSSTINFILTEIENSEVKVEHSFKGWQGPCIYEEIKLKNIKLENYYCSYLYQRMLIDIDSDGRFFCRLCCFLESPRSGFKNYFNGDNIYDVLNRHELITWRKNFVSNPSDICKKCLFLNKNLYS